MSSGPRANRQATSTPLVQEFLAKHAQVRLHFTPTHASWVNQASAHRAEVYLVMSW